MDNVDVLLIAISKSLNISEAYEFAEDIAGALDGVNQTIMEIVNYLSDENNAHRDIILSCFADYDVCLYFSPLKDVVKTLALSSDKSLLQSASMALNASADDSAAAEGR